jgi:hypothetical protein
LGSWDLALFLALDRKGSNHTSTYFPHSNSRENGGEFETVLIGGQFLFFPFEQSSFSLLLFAGENI